MKMGAADAFAAWHGAETDGEAGYTYVYTGWDAEKGIPELTTRCCRPLR